MTTTEHKGDDRRTAHRGGGAPGGTWRVVWRLHRGHLLGALGVIALECGLVLWYWIDTLRTYADVGVVDADVCRDQSAYSVVNTTDGPCAGFWNLPPDPSWSLFHLMMVVLPMLIGGVAGLATISACARTEVIRFSVSQAISFRRWVLVNLSVVVGPLVVSALGAGVLHEATARSVLGNAWTPLGSDFVTTGVIPAVLLLVGFTLAAALASAVRTTLVATLVTAIIVLAVPYTLENAVTGLSGVTRVEVPLEILQVRALPPDAVFIGAGLLTSAGILTVPPDECYGVGGFPDDFQDVRIAQLACLRDAGVVAGYLDFVPASRRTSLILAVVSVGVPAAALLARAVFVLQRRRIQGRTS